MKNGYLAQAWLVLVLALGFGAALAGVETWLRPRIDANKLAATLREIPRLVEGADPNASAAEEPVVVTLGEGRDRTRYEAFRAMTREDEQIGWVIKASGKGFADKIELLIGTNEAVESITGLAILEHKETPGLGNAIEKMGTKSKHGFLWPFFHWGPRADRPLVVVTGASPKMDEEGSANKIQAVSGATISSRSVCDIINETLGNRTLHRELAERARQYNERATSRRAAAGAGAGAKD
jgi:electron transport complex protein RnfG